MSSNITNISHGQANWDTTINQNFKNLDEDSDWVEIPLLAPFAGYLKVRAQFIEIFGTLTATEPITSTIGTNIATIPANLYKQGSDRYFVTCTDGNNGTARLCLAKNGNLDFLTSTVDITAMPIRISKMITRA